MSEEGGYGDGSKVEVVRTVRQFETHVEGQGTEQGDSNTRLKQRNIVYLN